MKKFAALAIIIFLLSGCSGKKIYEFSATLIRKQSDLTRKEVKIGNNLNVVYLENDVKSDITLVLLHGFGANKDNWLSLSNALKGKYHLIIPDLIGSGDSSQPLNIDYTLENKTKMLKAFLTQFSEKDKDIVLVGNSMGGQLALNYAYHYKLKGLILIDAAGIHVADSILDKMDKKEKIELYTNLCSAEKMEKLLDLSFSHPPYIPGPILNYLAEEKCRLSALETHKLNAIVDENLHFLDDLSDKTKSIHTPTLILWGEEDKIFHVKNAYAFHENIKASKLIIYKGVGHMPMVENSTGTAKNINDFLNTLK